MSAHPRPTPPTPTTPQATAPRGPLAWAARWSSGAAGQWIVNAPLVRLPENLKVSPGQRWLDVGCGRGGLLRLVADRVDFEEPPVGLDRSPRELERARRAAAAAGLAVRFAQGEPTALPFPERRFDLVTAGYVTRHLGDRELRDLLDEVYRVLAPGGLALLWDFAPVHRPLLHRWNRRVLDRGRPQVLRSTRRLQRFADEAGFPFTRPAQLRPFLFPPIPRASVLIGRPPDGWTPRA